MHGRGRGVALRDGLHFAALVRVLMLGHHKDCRVPAIGAIRVVAAHGKRVRLFAGHYVLPVWEVVVAHREYIYTYAAWSTSIQGTGVCKHAQVPAKSGARAQSAMRALACAYIYIYIYIYKTASPQKSQAFLAMSLSFDCGDIVRFCSVYVTDAVVLMYVVISVVILDSTLDLGSAATRACAL